MKAAANAVQAAIYTALTSDTGAGGLFAVGANLVLGVWDAAGVPEAQAMPYITIGEFETLPFVTMGREGEDLTATVNIWTRARGIKAANTILNRVNQCIGNHALSCSGYSLARWTFAGATSVPDPVSDVEHIVARYRVLLQET